MSNVQFAELKDKIDIKGTEVYMTGWNYNPVY